MKYEDKYPSAKHQDEPEMCIIKVNDTGKCIQCHELTSFIEINFEGYMCSEECNKNYTYDYLEACEKAGPCGSNCLCYFEGKERK